MKDKLLPNAVTNYGALWRGSWEKYYSLQEVWQDNILFTTTQHFLTWSHFCCPWICINNPFSFRHSLTTQNDCSLAQPLLWKQVVVFSLRGATSGLVKGPSWLGRNRGMQYIQCTANLWKWPRIRSPTSSPFFRPSTSTKNKMGLGEPAVHELFWDSIKNSMHWKKNAVICDLMWYRFASWENSDWGREKALLMVQIETF